MSTARGLAAVACLLCLATALQALAAQLPPTLRTATPGCDPIELHAVTASRPTLACAGPCGSQSGDRVEPGCALLQSGMRPTWRLLTGLRLDINTVSAADLQQLRGVGPHLAKTIVDDRTAHGPFASLADLRRIKGVGPKTQQKLAKYLQVRLPYAKTLGEGAPPCDNSPLCNVNGS